MTKLKMNQIVDLTIEKLVLGGEGLGRLDQFAIFVPGALPGDRIRGKIISYKPTYARALIDSIQEPSAQRCAPLCSKTDLCGGCQWQALDYPFQLQAKTQILTETLIKTGRQDPDRIQSLMQPILAMETPFYYRNKGQFPLQMVKGNIQGGLYQTRSHQLVPLKKCPIHHERINQIFEQAVQLSQEYGLQAYDEHTGRGELRHLVIRHGFSSGESLLGWVTCSETPIPPALLDRLRSQCPSLVGILQNINSNPGNRILGSKTRCLWGQKFLEEQLGDLRFQISLPSFFQINPSQTIKLYNSICKLAKLSGHERVLDAYAGTGSISLWLAPHVKHVLGIDVVPEAIANAQTNAKINHLHNLEFQVGKAETLLPEFLKHQEVDLVVLDPPRKGCAPDVLDSLIAHHIPNIVYVSCHPATLARDIAILTRQGYHLTGIQPVDMFPHTYHIETVCHLTKKEK